MAEREASGDFDYGLDDPGDADDVTSLDGAPEAEEPADFDYLFRDPDDDWEDPFADDPDDSDGGHFDAFNGSTWSFEPAPTPWYRTKQAVTAIVAAVAATAAIVISGVLLVFRGPSNTVDETTPTPPTSAAPTEFATSEPAPPPLEPPPPPTETVASPVNPGPVYANPNNEPRQTKAPAINVTRAPMSVAPQQRTPPSQRR